jgi:hypothetical protein
MDTILGRKKKSNRLFFRFPFYTLKDFPAISAEIDLKIDFSLHLGPGLVDPLELVVQNVPLGVHHLLILLHVVHADFGVLLFSLQLLEAMIFVNIKKSFVNITKIKNHFNGGEFLC